MEVEWIVFITKGSKVPRTESTIRCGQNADIDQAAEQLSTTSVGANQGVLVKALAANSGIVYVGPAGVTVATGYPLAAGEEVFIPIDNVNAVYVIASADNQGAAWIAT